MPLLVIWLLFGIAAALVASSKGANGCLWFGLGVLFGPFGLLFSFFAGGQKCPYCKKNIHREAIVCPYCQKELKKAETKVKVDYSIIFIFFVIVVFFVIIRYLFFSTNPSNFNPQSSEKNDIATQANYYDSVNNSLSKPNIKNSVSKKVTLDGYDSASGMTILIINIWKNYSDVTLGIAGTGNDGEKVKLIKREGDNILIETSKGVRGWVSYCFIKEFKQP
jgi:predicted nucleic acid-binding Zn ribbon protein